MPDLTDQERITSLGLAVFYIARHLAGNDSLKLAQFLMREADHGEHEGIDPRSLEWLRRLGKALEIDRFEVMLRSVSPSEQEPN